MADPAARADVAGRPTALAAEALDSARTKVNSPQSNIRAARFQVAMKCRTSDRLLGARFRRRRASQSFEVIGAPHLSDGKSA